MGTRTCNGTCICTRVFVNAALDHQLSVSDALSQQRLWLTDASVLTDCNTRLFCQFVCLFICPVKATSLKTEWCRLGQDTSMQNLSSNVKVR